MKTKHFIEYRKLNGIDVEFWYDLSDRKHHCVIGSLPEESFQLFSQLISWIEMITEVDFPF